MTGMGDREKGTEPREDERHHRKEKGPGIREQGNKRQITRTMTGHRRGDGEKEDFPNQALPILQN